MFAPSNYFCMAKITEAILNKIKVCGTFIIKFCIEIHLVKDDSKYHENKWHSLSYTAPSSLICVCKNNFSLQALLIISLWSFSTSLLHNVDFYQIYLVLYFCDSGPLAWSKARHEVMLLWLRLIDQTIASTVFFSSNHKTF